METKIVEAKDLQVGNIVIMFNSRDEAKEFEITYVRTENGVTCYKCTGDITSSSDYLWRCSSDGTFRVKADLVLEALDLKIGDKPFYSDGVVLGYKPHKEQPDNGRSGSCLQLVQTAHGHRFHLADAWLNSITKQWRFTSAHYYDNLTEATLAWNVLLSR